MIKVEAIVVRDRVETVMDAVEDAKTDAVVASIMDAARTGHVSGDGIVWTTPVDQVMHNRTGKRLEEVEVS